jgi:cytochrome c oxidase subunit 4
MMNNATTHAAHGHADDGRVHAHISSVKFLVGIFATLIFLTFITVYVSYFDFGSANTFVAVFVATVKATLVSLFFMHLRYDKPFNGVIFVMAFVFLGLLLLLCWDDLSTRGTVDEHNGSRILHRSGEIAPGSIAVPAAPAGGTAAPAAH